VNGARVRSTPTGRALRLASHADRYAVGQPNSITSSPATSPRTHTLLSGTWNRPHVISSAAHARDASSSVNAEFTSVHNVQLVARSMSTSGNNHTPRRIALYAPSEKRKCAGSSGCGPRPPKRCRRSRSAAGGLTPDQIWTQPVCGPRGLRTVDTGHTQTSPSGERGQTRSLLSVMVSRGVRRRARHRGRFPLSAPVAAIVRR
jgi:hypothetical protein